MVAQFFVEELASVRFWSVTPYRALLHFKKQDIVQLVERTVWDREVGCSSHPILTKLEYPS